LNIHLIVLIVWSALVLVYSLSLTSLVYEEFTWQQLLGQSIVIIPASILIPYGIYYYTIRKIINKIIEKRRKSKTS